MKRVASNVVILGAGLTGLTLDYYLRKDNISVNIIEARDRIGGRIHTQYRSDTASTELGATWLGTKHDALTRLLEQLGVNIFIQALGDTAVYEPMSINPPQIVNLPSNDDPSYRIRGGSSRVISALADNIRDDSIYLNQPALAISQKGKMITQTSNVVFESDMVISTLPPYLFYNTVQVIPELPKTLTDVAKETHTWMGDAIKIGLTYKKPFWREGNLSGTIFSNVGPIPEMYDHSNYEDNRYGLKGFFNGSYHSITREERLKMALNQLKKYFGEVVDDYLTYEETVWAKEKYTYSPYESFVLPHQNNGHEVFQSGFLDNRLYIGGAETANLHSGYMDGAVRSAQFLSNQVKSFFKL